MDSITNLPKDTDSLPDIALYSFDTMDNVKDTDYLDEANFPQNSNSSILENVFNRKCVEIDEKLVKEANAISSNNKVNIPDRKIVEWLLPFRSMMKIYFGSLKNERKKKCRWLMQHYLSFDFSQHIFHRQWIFHSVERWHSQFPISFPIDLRTFINAKTLSNSNHKLFSHIVFHRLATFVTRSSQRIINLRSIWKSMKHLHHSNAKWKIVPKLSDQKLDWFSTKHHTPAIINFLVTFAVKVCAMLHKYCDEFFGKNFCLFFFVRFPNQKLPDHSQEDPFKHKTVCV